MAEFALRGMKELGDALQNLPVKIEKNILRGALRAGAKVIEDDAKARVPVKTGKLRDSIRVSSRARRGLVTAILKAGGKGKGEAFYAHLVEFGSAPHDLRPKNRKALTVGNVLRELVAHPGAAPRPFMRPALDGKAAQAIEEVRRYIAKRLAREAAKR